MYRIILLTAILFSVKSYSQTIDISRDWLLTIGDTAEWSQPSFNDGNWKKAETIGAFERRELPDFKDFGWVRKKVVIPSTLRSSAEKYGYFYLSLGMINDADQTFFNGKMVGQKGTMPPSVLTVDRGKRLYKIDAEEILWDRENQIAVRIFSNFHNGGITTGDFYIVIPSDNLFHSGQSGIKEFQLPANRKLFEATAQPDAANKDEVLKTGGISLNLSLPADVPVIYNGKFIGKSRISGDQSFFVPASYISWGKADMITVYLDKDEPLENIIFSKPSFTTVNGNAFNFMQVLNFKIKQGSFEKNSPVTVSVEVFNTTNSDFQGKFDVMLTTDINTVHQNSSLPLHLNKSESKVVEFTIRPDFSGIYQINYILQNNKTGQAITGTLTKGEKI